MLGGVFEMAGRVAEKTSPARGVGCCQGGICRGTGGLSPPLVRKKSIFPQFFLIFYINPPLLFTTNTTLDVVEAGCLGGAWGGVVADDGEMGMCVRVAG